MTIALSPREIQSRLRAGASVAEVAKEAGVEVDRISGFALPVMAERAHVTRTALGASVRRRGDGSGHRRLGDLIHERLQARGLDADVVEWDSWRQSDLRWRLVGLLNDQAASRCAEFVYDTKGRFSVADNADARWMIGEELPRVANDPDNENTIDFHDEFALVRAISDDAPTLGRPGDDVPRVDSPYEGSAHTSELDELYDMLSGVSEDSVRIYLGLEDADDENEPASAAVDETTGSTNDATTDTGPEVPPSEVAAEGSESVTSGDEPRDHGLGHSQERASHTPGTDSDDDGTDSDTARPEESTQAAVGEPETRLADELSEHPELSTGTDEETAASVDAPSQVATDAGPAASAPSPVTPEQDPLIQEAPPASPPKRTPAKKRASIPSWDEIMFGGPSRS